jgi:hypothetical protein
MESKELSRDEAADVVVECARRLFPILSQRRAREIADVVLRDLEARGFHLIQDQTPERCRR